MKINDIILKEEIDQKEADMVYQSLIASGDPYDKQVAQQLQRTRTDPRYTSVDAAQQAAETRARNEMKTKINKLKTAEETGKIKVADPNEQSNAIRKKYQRGWNEETHGKLRGEFTPQEFKKYLPVIDQGFVKGVETGVVGLVKFTSDYADTDLAKLLPTPQVSYQSKLGRTRAS
tara:strand:- start:3390 stop:3914 length:525 start_codon:yes stop_codon:yes gene_type:complete